MEISHIKHIFKKQVILENNKILYNIINNIISYNILNNILNGSSSFDHVILLM